MLNRLFLIRLAVIAALLLRAMVPAGFMPQMEAGGKVPLVICSSKTGTATVYLPASDLPQEEGHDSPPAAPCAFDSIFATAIATPAAPVLPAPMPEIAALNLIDTSFTPSAPARSYNAQAPPAVLLHA